MFNPSMQEDDLLRSAARPRTACHHHAEGNSFRERRGGGGGWRNQSISPSFRPHSVSVCRWFPSSSLQRSVCELLWLERETQSSCLRFLSSHTHTHSQIRNHLLVSAADDAPVPGYLVCSVNSQKAVLLEMRAGYFWVPTQLDLVLKALLDELMRLSLLLKAQWRPLTQFNTAIQDFSDLKKMWEIRVCCGWLPRCC